MLQRTPSARTLPSPACVENMVQVLTEVAAQKTGQPVTLYISRSGSTSPGKVPDDTLAAYKTRIRNMLQRRGRPDGEYTQEGLKAALRTFNVVSVLEDEHDLYGRTLLDDDKSDRYMYLTEGRANWQNVEARRSGKERSSLDELVRYIENLESKYLVEKQFQCKSWQSDLSFIDGLWH